MSTAAYFDTTIPDTPIGDDVGPNVYVSKEVFQGFIAEYRSFTREFAYGMLRELCSFAVQKENVKEARLIASLMLKLTGIVLPTLPESTPEHPEYDFSDLLKISKEIAEERLADINTAPPLAEPAPPLDESIDPLTFQKFTKDKAYACYREIYLRAFCKGKITSARLTMDRMCGLRGFVAAKRISIGDLEVALKMAKDDNAIPTDEAVHRYKARHEAPKSSPPSAEDNTPSTEDNTPSTEDNTPSTGDDTPSAEDDTSYAEETGEEEQVYELPNPFVDEDGMPRHLVEQPYAVPEMPPHMAAFKPEENWSDAEALAAVAYRKARKIMLIEKSAHEKEHFRELERQNKPPDFATDEQYAEAWEYYALDEDHYYKAGELRALIDAAKAGRAEEVAAESVRQAQRSILPPSIILAKAKEAKESAATAEAAQRTALESTQLNKEEETEDKDDSANTDHPSRGPPE